ncbi:MAG: hypothetical protein HKN20_10105, partial [Gemmatimonadetes bacterium]|nr:hypothetical protein [Gemmatimonadota bacterium]
FVAESERPPYSLLYRVYDSIRMNPVIDTVYDRIRDPFGDHSEEAPHWDRDTTVFRGQWSEARDRMHIINETEEERKAREDFGALAYLRSYELAPPLSGVILHDEERAAPGLNFYMTAGGPSAFLMDMDGEVLHTWTLPFEQAFPSFTGNVRIGAEYWRYAHLYEDGRVLAIFARHGIIMVDKDSQLIWATEGDYHHVTDIDEDGTILVTGRRTTEKPEWDEVNKVWEEDICYLDPETGEQFRSYSLYDAIDNSPYEALRDHRREDDGDHLHANTVEILDGRFANRHPAFRKGNHLVSLRHLDTIGIVDPETETLVWALTGLFSMQHRPTFLDDGSIMVFSNNNPRRNSQVIQIDPLTQQVLWLYDDDVFYTGCCGVAWPLANGNVLITESQAGRVFEVTRDHEIVWDFYNPERRGENDVAIASVYEMCRFPLDYASAWLD